MTSDARNKELSESVLKLAAPTQAPNQALTRQPPKNLHNTGLTQASGPQVFFGPICLPFRDGTTGERPTRIKHPSLRQGPPSAAGRGIRRVIRVIEFKLVVGVMQAFRVRRLPVHRDSESGF
jgi:hypothetical protein